MALNPLNSSNLELLALKGLISLIDPQTLVYAQNLHYCIDTLMWINTKLHKLLAFELNCVAVCTNFLVIK